MTRTIVRSAPCLLAAALLLASAGAAHAWPKPESFDVELAPVGGSETTGIAHLVLRGDQLSVQIRAFGFDPAKLYPVALTAACGGPQGEVLAASGDRFLLASVPLDPAPRADRRGALIHQQTYRLNGTTRAPLAGRALVVYDPFSGAPIACGPLQPYVG